MTKNISPTRDDKGRFLTGNTGGPGRKPGSRNRIVQNVIDLYSASLEGTGAEDLERLRQKDLSTYWRLAMQFVPSKVESLLNVNVHHELSEEYEKAASFADAWNVLERARARLNAKPAFIEQEMIDLTPEAEAAWRAENVD
jgi:hypothetical protein